MKRPLCVVCLAFVVSIGILMQLLKVPIFSLGERSGTFQKIQGTVVKKQTKEKNVTVYLSNVTFSDEHNSPQIRGAICYSKQSDQNMKNIKIGSVLQVKGKVEDFMKASNPGEFDQKKYQMIEGYEFCCKDTIILKSSRSYDKKAEILYRIRERLSSSIEQNFSEQNAGIVKAMLLGEKQELAPEMKQLYQRNGISHILAISGLHIGILGMGFYKMLKKMGMPLFLASVLSIVFLYYYGRMTGMSSSCFRAILMFAIHLLATLHKRSYDMITAMGIAAVFLLMSYPLFIYQVGFLLSFGAIMGIGLIQPVLSHYSKIKPAFSASLSVNLITLPLLLFFYYEFPIYSLFLNLLIIPCMGIVLVMGCASAVGGVFFSVLSKIMAFPAEFVLNSYEKLCVLIDYLPYQTIVFGKPRMGQMVIYYAILLFLLFCYKQIKRNVAAILLVLAITLLVLRIPYGLEITFLDVGQGDGACMEAPNGEVYLIDAGSSTKKKVAEQQIIPFLKSRGHDTIDYVFLSHMDEDHISGIYQILELQQQKKTNIRIKRIVVPYLIKEDSKWNEIQNLARKQGVYLFYMHVGDKIQNGKLLIQCLFPKDDRTSEDSNENSMVLSVSYDHFDVLFTGDLEGKGELELVNELIRRKEVGELKDYEVLKAAHHGSKNAGGKQLLELLQAETAVISCGKKNQYGHPHKETLARFEEAGMVWDTTKEAGAITIWTNGKKWRINRLLSLGEKSAILKSERKSNEGK